MRKMNGIQSLLRYTPYNMNSYQLTHILEISNSASCAGLIYYNQCCISKLTKKVLHLIQSFFFFKWNNKSGYSYMKKDAECDKKSETTNGKMYEEKLAQKENKSVHDAHIVLRNIERYPALIAYCLFQFCLI